MRFENLDKATVTIRRFDLISVTLPGTIRRYHRHLESISSNHVYIVYTKCLTVLPQNKWVIATNLTEKAFKHITLIYELICTIAGIRVRKAASSKHELAVARVAAKLMTSINPDV